MNFEPVSVPQVLGNLWLGPAEFLDPAGQPISVPVAGQITTVRASWLGTQLTPLQSFVVRVGIDGVEYDSTLIEKKTRDANGTVTLAQWTAAPGTHTLTIRIDPTDRVGETTESDNTVSVSFTVSAPVLPPIPPVLPPIPPVLSPIPPVVPPIPPVVPPTVPPTTPRPTPGVFAVGADAGSGPVVRLATGGTPTLTFSAEDPSFTGGIRVAVGDVTGDGVPDVVTGTGPGAATARVFDGRDGHLVSTIVPFGSEFRGGLFVSVADFDRDGRADIVMTPDVGGGPRVVVYSGRDGSVIADFLGITDGSFRGGARTGVGDVDGDGTPDLLVAAGFGGGPRVALWDGRSVAAHAPAKMIGDFFVFEQGLRNGAYAALGDLNGDGRAELIAGGGPGGSPRVLALDGADPNNWQNGGRVVANFFAGDEKLRSGVRVAAGDFDGDGVADIYAAGGAGGGGTVQAFRGRDATARDV